MGLQYSGVTLASHVLLILALLIVFARAQYLRRVEGSLGAMISSSYVRMSVIAVFTALIVERGYYIAARLLSSKGVDLWSAHPAPELLSLGCGLAVWHVSVAAKKVAASNGRITIVLAGVELAALLCLWGLIGVVLW
ncbi:hypothetical protein [Oceaniglobus trochenteri]|uniref:hypothetical protein n=1 Tax=Oceaniglobus trochenteri TaxID=2763260 RepID=UPI001CFFBC99|nr:hypothetical protein [Oceaniglobus trochenteri]